MTSCHGVRMSGGMAGLIVADAGGGGDAAVFAEDAENAPPDNQIPGGAQLIATGGPVGVKSVVAVSAPLVINGETSREDICAVGARFAALSTARVTPVIHEVDMYDGSAEVPHPSVNRNWLNVVTAYAKGRKYDGLSIMPQAPDQETRLQHFKFHVATAIRFCQGSRLYKANIDMV
jgi:hypothetical protein